MFAGRTADVCGPLQVCASRPAPVDTVLDLLGLWPDLPLSIRSWTCSGCGADHDRNVKASRNLLAWASGWGGAGVRDHVEPLDPRRAWPRELSRPMDRDEARLAASAQLLVGTGVAWLSGGQLQEPPSRYGTEAP